MDARWTAVDALFEQALLAPDAALETALLRSREAGLPEIAVSPLQGRLLGMLARSAGARRILEIGTLGGYSTIALARAVPDGGSVVTLEYEPRHAEVARANLAHAGLASVVDVRVGAALDLLPALAGSDPFDFTFIDADKPNNPHYFQWALDLSRPGALIVVDNVVRDGKVADPKSDDPGALGVRALLAKIADEPRVEATAVQTVGSKGYDGFLLARVIA